MVNTFSYYKNKKVLLKDIFEDLQDKVVIFYKKEKVKTYDKKQIKNSSWSLDRVIHVGNYYDEGLSQVYLEPTNLYLRSK